MNRKKRLIRNLIVLAILIPILINRFGLYLTAEGAHKASERSIHYGPSEIIHVKDLGSKKLFLCKYDKWISCNTSKRALGLFWQFGNQVTGVENKTEQPFTYTWNGGSSGMVIYGIINDPSIIEIRLVYSDSTIIIDTFYEDMFMHTWDSLDNSDYPNVQGYNSSGELVYESMY